MNFVSNSVSYYTQMFKNRTFEAYLSFALESWSVAVKSFAFQKYVNPGCLMVPLSD